MGKRRVRIEFDIPEDADWSTLEELALRAAREAVERAMSEEWGTVEDAGPCPGCGKKGQSATG